MTTRVSTALLGAGAMLQVVSTQNGALATNTSIIPTDNTIPQNTEGAELMTATITPLSATSQLRVEVTVCCAPSGAFGVTAALFRDSGANALAAVTEQSDTANARRVLTFSHIVTAGSTAATTFRVRGGCSAAGTFNFNGDGGGGALFGGVMSSSITITEIAA